MPEIISLKPGRYLDSSGVAREFTAEDLEATAAAYSAELHEAPIVIGHPKHDAPAFGWIKGVRFDGGELKLDADQVNPEFSEMHRSGAFKKHSIALYPPDDPRNPKPGVWYPRHIGFLGAMPPAIKGLPQAEFSEQDQPIEIAFGEIDSEGLVSTLREMFRRVREYIIERSGREDADRVIPDWEIESIQHRVTQPDPEPLSNPQFSEEPSMPEENAGLTPEQLAAREADITAREQRIAQQEAQRRRADAVSFAEQLADQGKILPRQQPAVAELMLALPTDEVEFSEGDETRSAAPEALFREFLENLPQAIEFGERSAEELPDSPADLTLPAGCTANADSLQRLAKAKAYQRQHGCEFSEAVKAVTITQ